MPKKKNKGRRNPRKVQLRNIQLELKHRSRRVEDQIVKARVRQAIELAPWQEGRERNPELIITRWRKYRNKIFVSQKVKLRNAPIRLVEAQVVEVLEAGVAELVSSDSDSYSYYSAEEGQWIEEPEEGEIVEGPEPASTASGSGRQGPVALPRTASEERREEIRELREEIEDLDAEIEEREDNIDTLEVEHYLGEAQAWLKNRAKSKR